MIVCAKISDSDTQEKVKILESRGIEVLTMSNEFGKVDLPKLFAYLAQERHMNEIHIEAGFKLNGSMLREDCVDELLLYYAPFFMGECIGMANTTPLDSLQSRQDWKMIDQSLVGSDLRLRLIKSKQEIRIKITPCLLESLPLLVKLQARKLKAMGFNWLSKCHQGILMMLRWAIASPFRALV